MQSYNIKFQCVTTFIIGDGGNLSVGAPYTRGSQSKTFHIHDNGSRESLVSLNQRDLQALENIDRISTYSQFIQNYDNLDAAIQAKMLGASADSTLQSQLNQLQQRVSRSGMDSSQQSDFNTKIHQLLNMASGCLRNTFDIPTIAKAKRN